MQNKTGFSDLQHTALQKPRMLDAVQDQANSHGPELLGIFLMRFYFHNGG